MTTNPLTPTQPDDPTIQVYLGHHQGRRYLPIANLLQMESDANYTWLLCHDGQRVLLPRTLKHIEAQLPPGQFVRLRRDLTVNIDYIEHITRVSHNRMVVQLRNGATVEVARRRITELSHLLGFHQYE